MNLLKNIKIKNWLIFLGILFIFLYLDYFILAIYYTIGVDIYNLTLINKIIILISRYVILIAFFIIKDYKYLKEKWHDFTKNFKKYYKISLKNWFAGFIIMIISNYIISYFYGTIGQNESGVQSLIAKLPLLAFFLTTILAPFVEEMVFRKCLKDCVNQKTLYMILSGLIFGFIHTSISTNILELLLIIPYGALGFMFAKTINETDNIYATIIMHMLHNGVLTLIAIGGI